MTWLDVLVSWKALYVMLAIAATDFFWARYFQHTAAKNAVKAGLYSGLILLFGSTVVVSYVEQRILIIPVVIGAYIGTYCAIRFFEVKP